MWAEIRRGRPAGIRVLARVFRLERVEGGRIIDIGRLRLFWMWSAQEWGFHVAKPCCAVNLMLGPLEIAWYRA